ncbi:MAG: hypothetical protein RIT14_2582 [Pseudomonadota bacterium]|jgi:ribosomal protein S18 acetylase RimI-like enzyme
MTGAVTLRAGLPDGLRHQAAAIYWQAFGGKLGRVLGPEAVALRFLDRVMRADHCIAALDGAGQLLGLVGFKTAEGSFAGGGAGDLRAVYGRWGGAWRGAALRALGQEVDDARFLIDGICVAPSAQGQGIGRALIEAVCAEGRLRGFGAVRLDVADSNLRARALYERAGFVLDGTAAIGPLRLIFGFRAAHRMVRAV